MRTSAKVIDTTHYPETDFMGEGELQRYMTELLRPLLARFLAEAGRTAHVGANQFFYYQQFNTAKRTAPDLYVLFGVPQEIAARCWKLWEMSTVPAFCLEIVSLDVGKDYDGLPPVHSEIGTSELVIYDPDAKPQSSARSRLRHAWQVHRRTERGLYLVETSSADRIYSKELGCWLRVMGRGDARRIRLATGTRGDDIVLTDAERAEEERAEKERERAEKERERAARVALEAEVAKLKKLLEKQGGKGRR